MLQHDESSNIGWIPIESVVAVVDAGIEVVVFAAPAVERVGKSIDGFELLARKRSHSAKVVFVLQTVFPFVDCHRHVFRTRNWAFVGISET